MVIILYYTFDYYLQKGGKTNIMHKSIKAEDKIINETFSSYLGKVASTSGTSFSIL